MKLKYRRHGYRYAHDLPGEWEAEDELEEMAEAAAQDYWSNHDGFEARWPLTFEILLPDGGLIGSGWSNERRVSRLKGNDMTKMIDTEGDALPNNGPDDKYDNCWDINLWGDGELSLSIPMSFDAGDGGNYNGAGVVTVGLRELLQEYLDDCDRLDGGEGLQPLAAMFREFADKYEAAAKTPNA